jgi:hypothetical protein
MNEPTDSERGKRAGRDRKGRFLRGHGMPGPGNPHLRRAAELQAAVRAAVTGDDLRAVLHKLRDLALAGDPIAARTLLERCLGRPREEVRPIQLKLPPLKNEADLAAALRTVVAAVASGDLTVAEGASVVQLLQAVGEAAQNLNLPLDEEAEAREANLRFA